MAAGPHGVTTVARTAALTLAASAAAAKPSGDDDDFADMALDAEPSEVAAQAATMDPSTQQQAAVKAKAKKPRRKKVRCSTKTKQPHDLRTAGSADYHDRVACVAPSHPP